MDWPGKWNYEVKFIGKVSKKTKNRFLVAQTHEAFEVKSLPLNDFEKKVIKTILKIIEALFNENNMAKVPISPQQIIILTNKRYKKQISDNSRGKCSCGYIYLVRDKCRWRFVRTLVHELAHLISFYSLEVEELDGGKSGGYCRINSLRLGYEEVDAHNNKSYYNGLNEAATELVTDAIISRVLKTKLLLIKDRRMIKGLVSYPYHAVLITIILRQVKDAPLWKSLVKSYFDGSNTFISLLHELMPKASKPIRLMSITNESAWKTAYLIGGDSLKEEVLNSVIDYS